MWYCCICLFVSSCLHCYTTVCTSKATICSTTYAALICIWRSSYIQNIVTAYQNLTQRASKLTIYVPVAMNTDAEARQNDQLFAKHGRRSKLSSIDEQKIMQRDTRTLWRNTRRPQPYPTSASRCSCDAAIVCEGTNTAVLLGAFYKKVIW
jgi:hypothetical protein